MTEGVWVLIGVMLLGLALVGLSGCASAPPPVVSTNDSEKRFTVVLSGDTEGFLVPCGCAAKQFGGLPRRGTYLQRLRADSADGAGTLYLDAGGSVRRATDYDALKLEYIVRGMAKMGPAALNLGAGEVLLGAEKLRSLAQTGDPLLSSNVTAEGQAPWKDHIAVNVGGAKVAILGVCIAPAKVGPGLAVRDAEEALRATVPALAKAHDALILLVHGSEDACLKLCGAFPELTAVFAAGVPQPIKPRLVDDRTVFAATAQKGKFLARAELLRSPSSSGERGRRLAGWRLGAAEIAELDESIPDQKEQLQNVRDYKARLREVKLEPAATGEAPAMLASLPRSYRFAGSAACAECHEDDDRLHRDSKHGKAIDVLRERAFDYDPYCLKCHTTGYGGPGGFTRIDRTPELCGVGCESCHGPSLQHVEDPRTRTTASAAAACAPCHDPENSPKFDYKTYYPNIVHGQVKATQWKRKSVQATKERPHNGD